MLNQPLGPVDLTLPHTLLTVAKQPIDLPWVRRVVLPIGQHVVAGDVRMYLADPYVRRLQAAGVLTVTFVDPAAGVIVQTLAPHDAPVWPVIVLTPEQLVEPLPVLYTWIKNLQLLRTDVYRAARQMAEQIRAHANGLEMREEQIVLAHADTIWKGLSAADRLSIDPGQPAPLVAAVTTTAELVVDRPTATTVTAVTVDALPPVIVEQPHVHEQPIVDAVPPVAQTNTTLTMLAEAFTPAEMAQAAVVAAEYEQSLVEQLPASQELAIATEVPYVASTGALDEIVPTIDQPVATEVVAQPTEQLVVPTIDQPVATDVPAVPTVEIPPISAEQMDEAVPTVRRRAIARP